ncbi:dipeptidase [Granulicella mallensis]|uniref:Membrane dipeptidase n=1 Tax=Granulicella mallensis TaxID=940614 RepID=A0A7W8ECF4_9BACT|nr:dipeptidase [Granulicella mallensis]MBB5066842.1 membrane dipeptidase [Granulicella mallensis]
MLQSSSQTDYNVSGLNHMQDFAKFHASTLVIDAHADTPQRFVDEGWNFSDPLNSGMLNLDSAREGNLAAEFFAIWVEPKGWRGRYAYRTLQLIDGVYEQLRKHPTTMRLGLTPADIVQAHRDRVFCALLGIEGGHSIEADLGLLRLYHRLGVRYMTLTWTNTNEWADSSGDLDNPSVHHHNGLNDFGRDVIREMNRLGMMVDVSHVSDKTFWDVLQTTHAPIIASHSSSRALTDTLRNLTDEQLCAVATNNGVVMVNFCTSFIDDNWRTAWAATQPQREPLYAAATAPYLERGEPVPYSVFLAIDRAFYAQHLAPTMPLAPFDSLIDHFDHVAKVAGIDHVGIGSDFDGFSILPAEISSAADLPKITAALQQRGYTEEQLKKLLGGNLLRVFADVQAEAAKE